MLLWFSKKREEVGDCRSLQKKENGVKYNDAIKKENQEGTNEEKNMEKSDDLFFGGIDDRIG